MLREDIRRLAGKVPNGVYRKVGNAPLGASLAILLMKLMSVWDITWTEVEAVALCSVFTYAVGWLVPERGD